MSTVKQIAANRLNAQKPRTVQANSASRYNALKHGIYAERLIMFEEKAEDLAELAAEYHEFHAPANPVERAHVDTLIHNEWRLRRLRRVEAGLWKSGYDLFVVKSMIAEIDNDAANTCTAGDAYAANPAVFDRVQRTVNSCQRHYHQALKELRLAQAQPLAQRTPQPTDNTAGSANLAAFRQIPKPAPPSPPPAVKIAPPSDSMDDLIPPGMDRETFYAKLEEQRAKARAKYYPK